MQDVPSLSEAFRIHPAPSQQLHVDPSHVLSCEHLAEHAFDFSASPGHPLSPKGAPMQCRVRIDVELPHSLSHLLHDVHRLHFGQGLVAHSSTTENSSTGQPTSPRLPFEHARSRYRSPAPHVFEHFVHSCHSAQNEHPGWRHCSVSVKFPSHPNSPGDPKWQARSRQRVPRFGQAPL